jgi:hypothetical protein
VSWELDRGSRREEAGLASIERVKVGILTSHSNHVELTGRDLLLEHGVVVWRTKAEKDVSSTPNSDSTSQQAEAARESTSQLTVLHSLYHSTRPLNLDSSTRRKQDANQPPSVGARHSLPSAAHPVEPGAGLNDSKVSPRRVKRLSWLGS